MKIFLIVGLLLTISSRTDAQDNSAAELLVSSMPTTAPSNASSSKEPVVSLDQLDWTSHLDQLANHKYQVRYALWSHEAPQQEFVKAYEVQGFLELVSSTHRSDGSVDMRWRATVTDVTEGGVPKKSDAPIACDVDLAVDSSGKVRLDAASLKRNVEKSGAPQIVSRVIRGLILICLPLPNDKEKSQSEALEWQGSFFPEEQVRFYHTKLRSNVVSVEGISNSGSTQSGLFHTYRSELLNGVVYRGHMDYAYWGDNQIVNIGEMDVMQW